MNPNRYIATFKYSKWRWFVTETGGGYEGVRIHDARQLKYGNKPDAETGLFLGEQFGYFGHGEVKTLKIL
jgi:hypothetical protein